MLPVSIRKKKRLIIYNILIIIIVLCVSSVPVHTDGIHPNGIRLDGTIGTSGKISLAGPQYDIKAEYGVQSGSNLFHSFEQFNVHSGESAVFNGPGSVQNIISRITGGSASWLDGRIGSAIFGANLYMLNRAGIMVGPDASLDLSGSFHISTADYLRMGNDGQFFSSPRTGENLLTLTAPPSAFGFLDNSAAPITFEGRFYNESEWDGNYRGLTVPVGETVSVIGGDIRMKGNYVLGSRVRQLGNLNAPEGKIIIAGVASSGEVVPTASEPDMSSFSSFANITLSDQSLILASGDGSGSIFIRGGQFYMDRSNIEADTTGNKDGGVIDIRADAVTLSIGNIFSDTWGTGRGGDISISADDAVLIAQNSKIFADATGVKAENGNAGSVSVNTKKFNLTSNSTISSETYGVGAGGSITVRADEEVGVSGEGKIFTRSVHYNKEGKPGDAGAVLIETEKFSLSGGSTISSDTYGVGVGGNISVTGSDGGFADVIEISGSRIFAGAIGKDGDPEQAGNVFLKAKSASFLDGGKIGSESEGQGKGGDVSVHASDSLTFSGNDSDGYASRIYTTAKSAEPDAGNAGNIRIQAGNISFSDGGGVTASTLGSGQGGSVDISASGTIDIDGINPHGENEDGFGSGIFARSESAESGAGRGGDIRISAGALSVTQGGVITSSSLGEGQGGNISVSGGAVSVGGTGFPSAAPLKSQIDFQHTASGYVNDTVSGIYSRSESVSPSGGGAGNIDLSAADLDMTYYGKISTSTEGGGNAGAITVSAGRIRTDTYASVSSSTNSPGYGGSAGVIDISASLFVNMTTGSAISTSSQGSGDAGHIRVYTTWLDMNAGAAVSSSSNSAGYGGSAGTIDILASESAVVKNAANISTSSEGIGSAGSIDLKTLRLMLDGGASVSSASNSTGDGGDAGMIRIAADTSVHLLNRSSVTTSSEGSGSAGAIDIDTAYLWLDGSSVIASSANSPVYSANAGAISVGMTDKGTDTVYLSKNSIISTSGEGFGKGGDIVLAASEVLLDAGAALKSTGVNGDAGTIRISGQDASANRILMGENSSISTSGAGTGDAGAIDLNALQIEMGKNAVIASSSLFPGKSGDAGAIVISAGNEPVRHISMNDGAAVTTSTEGTGDAGAIGIDVTTLEMHKHAVISSSSNFPGPGGNAGSITIRSKSDPADAVTLTDGSAISTSSAGTGNAGSIDLDVRTLNLTANAVISSASNGAGESGNAGSITVNAGENPAEAISLADGSAISTSSEGTGNAGSIDLDVRTLNLTANAVISSASNGAGKSGNAGNITVSAGENPADAVSLTDGSAISTSSEGTGKGGSIFLNAVSLDLNQNSTVRSTGNIGDAGTITVKHSDVSEIRNGSSVSTSGKGSGSAGAIYMETASLLLENASSISSSAQSAADAGNAGKITVTGTGIPTKNIQIHTNSDISTASAGYGLGGDILLETDALSLDGGSAVLASGNHGDAGKISVNAVNAPTRTVSLMNGSSVSTSGFGTGSAGAVAMTVQTLDLRQGASVSSASNFAGNGGDAGMIVIDAGDAPSASVLLDSDSFISTSAEGSGKGGNIVIGTDILTLDNHSGISASGKDGDAGSVTIRQMSQMTVNNQSAVSTSGSGLGNAGAITLETKKISVDNMSSVTSSSNFPGAGGNAGEIRIFGNSAPSDSIRLSNAGAISTSAEGSGKGGNIILETKSLTMDRRAAVTSAGKDGDAGSVTVKGTDICSMNDQSLISTSSSGSGNAGAVTVDAVRLQIDNSSVSSSGTALENGGDGGVIAIGSRTDPVRDIQIVNSGSVTTSTEGTGNAGAITIYSLNLTLDSAVISSASNSPGRGGNAGTITAGGLRMCILQNGSAITTSGEGDGKGGDISVQSSELRLEQASSVRASGNTGDAGSITVSDGYLLSLHSGSQITTSTKGKGRAGEIMLTAARLEMTSGGSVSSATTSAGNGGDAGSITVIADESVTMKDPDTSVSTESAGQGKAGDIVIITDRFIMENFASVSSSGVSGKDGGDAGTITIQADDFIQMINSALATEAVSAGGGRIRVLTNNLLSMENSKISTSVWLGRGDGGDIEITKPLFIIMKESDIIAKAYEGTGGSIHIVADQFIRSVVSVVSASSLLGIDGNVNIESPDANLSGSLIALPGGFLDAARWAVTPCAERTGENVSRLVFIERDGVYSAVDDWLPSP